MKQGLTKIIGSSILNAAFILSLSGGCNSATSKTTEKYLEHYGHKPPITSIISYQETHLKPDIYIQRQQPKPIQDKTYKSVYKQLEEIVNLSALTPDMSFSEAIDILSNSTEPRLNIVVLWRNLENADIYRETPIGMNCVSGIQLENSLRLLLDSISINSPEKLGYVVDDRVIIISTKNSLPVKMTTKVYDISDLTNRPADYYSEIRAEGGGGISGGGE